MRNATHMAENQAVADLLQQYPLDEDMRKIVSSSAGAIVATSRTMTDDHGTLDAFLQEFGLSNQEGVALMCLAEALLRIPDADTQDSLIAEKIKSGNWAEHRGQSDNTFVNASVWALMLTGGVINLDNGLRRNPKEWMSSMLARVGEPVIREATLQAMKIMGKQFVFGRSIKEALKRKNKQPAHSRLYSFDMLGEGARTQWDAERYQDLYMDSIHAVGKDGKGKDVPHTQRSSVSIKLSALHPRYEEVNKARVMAELLPRIKELALTAKSYDMGLTIDAEEAARLDISLALFEALARDKDLAGWQGLGLAVQAYQKRGLHVINWLIDLAQETNRRFPVRLVKGAYWDTEIKHTQMMGLDDYPVFTRKASTDLSYITTAKRMLDNAQAFYPQFATHNAHSIAAIAHMGKGVEYEFQRLHGMGDVLYASTRKLLGNEVIYRTYAPVGAHKDLLPYLVRRLLENGANSSFVNRFMDAEVPVEDIVQDPYDTVSAFKSKRHTGIPLPRNLYDDRLNSIGLDIMNPLENEHLIEELNGFSSQSYSGASIVSGADTGGDDTPVRSPSNTDHVVGQAREAQQTDMDTAIEAAHAFQPQWNKLGGMARADILDKAADLLEDNTVELISLMNREAGKTIADGVSEVREAADFCRFYAKEAREKFGAPTRLQGPTGETNELSLHGRGVFLTISPWNFPLAIFAGQVMAALAAGNTVLAKPAEQTPLIAHFAVKLFHQAGVPVEALHLLVGDGLRVGAPLVADERVEGVAFTGSTETAKAINRSLANRDGAIVPLIAETGGQNCMFVDSSALPEQVADDVMMSAFGSAGQRCSALRVLFIQDDVADHVIDMIKGALAERTLGAPDELSTDIGPIIDAEAKANLDQHVERMMKEATLIAKAECPKGLDNGHFFAPHIFEIPSLDLLTREVFGPILHIIRFKSDELDAALDSVRATGFGLTFGVHSRIEARWLNLFDRCATGNTYVNRNMIGAVVGVQPFGGQGLSGTGPKAGGPHYLTRFATERVLTINTAAIGGNTDLFRLQEGESNV